MCEKPLALTVSQVARMLTAVHRRGVMNDRTLIVKAASHATLDSTKSGSPLLLPAKSTLPPPTVRHNAAAVLGVGQPRGLSSAGRRS
jgi:hypothetical protein